MPLDLARARAASALSEIRVLTRNLVVHRYTTDGALGPFVTRELIPQATARKQRLALPPWNDGAVHTSHVLPAGAVVCVGRATASFGQPGGGTQLYVPSLETHPDRIKYRELEAFIAA